VTHFGAVRTSVLIDIDIIECQEEIPGIPVNCIKLSHHSLFSMLEGYIQKEYLGVIVLI